MTDSSISSLTKIKPRTNKKPPRARNFPWAGYKVNGPTVPPRWVTSTFTRPRILGESKDFRGKISIRRVPTEDGRDGLGIYWGSSSHDVWWVYTQNNTIDFCIRAESRLEAYNIVSQIYPKAWILRPPGSKLMSSVAYGSPSSTP